MTPHFDKTETEIFSNDLGCFDHNRSENILAADTYTYYGGDSFAWGCAHIGMRASDRYEQMTGRVTLNCEVTHTGQVHQFAKFQKLVARLNRYPSRVFITYFSNDPINDAGHDFVATLMAKTTVR